MTVTLKVNSKTFEGWQSVRIDRGIEQIAGVFSLSVTDRWNTDTQAEARTIKPGQACEVAVDGVVVITGYLDTVAADYDAGQHSLTITGRDKTGDLVDCSSIYKSGQWANKTIEQIAADLCAPFWVAVSTKTDTGEPFKTFSIQEGESVFETLERAARLRAVLLVSDGLGGLVITRAGSAMAGALTEGVNILSATAEFSHKDRFSQYIVKGQSHGDDNNYAEVVSQPSGIVTDGAITRYRPLIITAEDQGNNATLKQRAEWERNVRRGRGNRATIKVQGWGKPLWTPNTISRVISPLLPINADLLIVSVSLSIDDGGTTTTIELTDKSAFDTIEGVKQTRLEKKLRKKQGDEQGITQPEWEWPQ